jgi:hypothetical protein
LVDDIVELGDDVEKETEQIVVLFCRKEEMIS